MRVISVMFMWLYCGKCYLTTVFYIIVISQETFQHHKLHKQLAEISVAKHFPNLGKKLQNHGGIFSQRQHHADISNLY